MTQHEKDGGALRRVLEDLAGSRGYTLRGVAEEARRRGHAFTPVEIVGGRGGFGEPVSDVLDLDGEECRRLAGALFVGRPGSGAAEAECLPEAPGFGRYPQTTPPGARKGAPVCCVSHPDAGGPCGEPATMTVWSLSFCEPHGEEAEYAAMSEMLEGARFDLEAAIESERPRWRKNAGLLYLLRQAADEAQAHEESHSADHEEAAGRVYGDADPSRTHRDTLMFDPADFSAGYPSGWWGETRRALCRSMREAHEEGNPALLRELEPLREWATVQEGLAVRHELAGFELPT